MCTTSASAFNLDNLTFVISPTGFVCVIVLWAIYCILVALYNVSPLHPLSQIPGPKLAAASYIYEAYYDWWRRGKFGHEIRRMHECYGEFCESCLSFANDSQVQSWESILMSYTALTRLLPTIFMPVQGRFATNGYIKWTAAVLAPYRHQLSQLSLMNSIALGGPQYRNSSRVDRSFNTKTKYMNLPVLQWRRCFIGLARNPST